MITAALLAPRLLRGSPLPMPRIRRLRTGRDRTILRAARRWAAPSDDSSGYAQGSAQQAPANRTSGFLGRLWETNTVPAMRRNSGAVYASHRLSNKSRAYHLLKQKAPARSAKEGENLRDSEPGEGVQEKTREEEHTVRHRAHPALGRYLTGLGAPGDSHRGPVAAKAVQRETRRTHDT
jgi:hypothetical protein